MTLSATELKRREAIKAQVAARKDEACLWRQTEHFWKRRTQDPDLGAAFQCDAVQWLDEKQGVWSAANDPQFKVTQVKRYQIPLNTEAAQLLGRQEDAVALTFPSMPGLVYLPSLLYPSAQRALVKCCLKDGPRHPNMTSLDPHYEIPLQEGLWQAFQRHPDLLIPKTVNAISQKSKTRERIDLPAINKENYAIERANDRLQDLEQSKIQALRAEETVPVKEVLDKLRWASVGIKYHWGTKSYILDEPAPPVPQLISSICQSIVGLLPWSRIFPPSSQIDHSSWSTNYAPEGGIINYYSPRDILCGHIDHSEADTVRPLVSISLGLSAIFLIGGESRDVRPFSILLESGDVVLMAGESRRVFHGVPRILEGGEIEMEGDEQWLQEGFAEWMKRKRINLNMRQVFPSD